MAVTPSTNLKLLSVPIEIDNRNQLTFATKQSQYNYFNNLPSVSEDDFTYQRKDSTIRYPGHIDNLRQYNYCMYQNENYNDKWFYAFITRMDYINDNMTLISITTDVWQTWQFELNWKRSFVEREHVNNDTIGLHTYPEDVETGEYIVNSVYVDGQMDDFLNDCTYVIGSTVKYSETESKFPFTGGNQYNGLYSGVRYYTVSGINTEANVNLINHMLQKYAENGQSDTITGIFIIPKVLAPNATSTSPSEVASSTGPYTYSFNFPKTYGLNGYTPKNNKMYTYQFCYLIGSNSNGNDNTYRYEDFASSNCTFKVSGVLTPGGSVRCVPTNYKGTSENDMEAITLGKYPICNYAVDMYTNWLTQNSINIGGTNITSDELSLARNTFNTGLGIKTSKTLTGMISDAVGGVFDIANSLIAQKQHSLIPPSVQGNLNCGDVITSDSKNNFRFYRMSIKKEYAEKIDNFLSMFGYKIATTKVPNITGRQNWNFVQTRGCNVTANIPQEDLQEIKNIFNNGVTLWHNPSTFLDYSQNNAII